MAYLFTATMLNHTTEETMGYEKDACNGFDVETFEAVDAEACDSFEHCVYDGYEFDDGYLDTDDDGYQ